MPAKGVSPILEPEKRGLSTLKTSQKRGLTIKIWSKGVSPNKNFRGPFGPPKRGLLNLEKGGTTAAAAGGGYYGTVLLVLSSSTAAGGTAGVFVHDENIVVFKTTCSPTRASRCSARRVTRGRTKNCVCVPVRYHGTGRVLPSLRGVLLVPPFSILRRTLSGGPKGPRKFKFGETLLTKF